MHAQGFLSRLLAVLAVALLAVPTPALADDIGYRAIPYSFVLGAIFLLVYLTGLALLDPFEGLPSDTPMASIIRTIEINLLEQIGETDVPPPVEPVDGKYLL